MSLVTLKINDKEVQVEQGKTILDAARELNIKIPTLCYLNLHDKKTENKPGSCRVCVVEVEGRRNLAPACCTPVSQGMVIKTSSPKALSARKTILELLLSDHPNECLTCAKSMNCELQELAAEYGIRRIEFNGSKSISQKEDNNYSIARDTSKCILCRRCETVCNEVQKVGAISSINRGFNTTIAPAFGSDLKETKCTFCGQCVAVCPTGALVEKDNTSKVWRALADEEKVVIVQTAPAVRSALGEEFNCTPGTSVTGKMAASLKALGFDKVFDTDFAADLTILEEAREFLTRVQNGENLPMITSCCPGWVTFIEKHYHDLLNLPSSCKSPQQMWGSIAKSYFAEKMNIDPKNLVVVSVMPCIAKKSEAARDEFTLENGVKDVDIVISTRELARMIKEAGIDFNSLENEEFDNPMGESTGAGVIFGTSGGVMEAALRTAYEWLTKNTLEQVDFEAVRGLTGVKEATINIDGTDIKVAIVSGLGNARDLLEKIRAGNTEYHFIEVMACPGGCINGGGQPYSNNRLDIIEGRMQVLYNEDKGKHIRKSHDNPEIQRLYEEFLGEPNSHKAHELLHTHYIKR
ncbi:NADH-dependent [FeFe] hydrogenase, group A6 [Clostridium sp. UBA4548]|uniref:NADH-dependent [FeFe] hydrogenase, group A6 n=1 Tax=Clostridium sp. UBA4548 TaxID=1946361 RepID=UPI0025C0EA10|nr:NADH-dependent [FeFe] hydrogenase, group A6 [Clostridium sp. UBA4548]